jgi:flagellar basal-body rod protein FlgB
MSALIDNLERYLDLTAFRQKLVSANVANVDTPGYRTRDVAFQAELQRAMHWSGASAPSIHSVRGLITRPDGNNVNIDRETMLLAETQLQFRMGVQLLRGEFGRMLLAINEGKQS